MTSQCFALKTRLYRMPAVDQLKRLLIGQPLATHRVSHERIPKWKALSTLSSDALSSVAYATDEILLVLAGVTGALAWSIPIAIAIVTLLVLITASYRQTIDAYPNGGGAYTVAKENLGVSAGLIAAAALLIDYILTVSVSVAAGVENIAAAFPFLSFHKESIGAVVIILIMIANLRGIRESSTIFAFPTYFFVFSILILLAAGFWKVMSGSVVPVVSLAQTAFPAVPLILVLRAFASGCSALTGVEAISNGVTIFEHPTQRNAKITLLWMSVILGVLFLGITFLAHSLGISMRENETVISLVGKAVFGPSVAYYLVQIATALILFLAANTSYADFPRLSSLLAKDRYLPRQLASMGDRLVFSNGIIGLSVAAILLIFIFKGETSHLIPLYAVGVFLSFTLSQAGMVVHHIRIKEPRWMRSLFFNALGAVATLVVLVDIASTKFIHGAWMVVVAIPVLVFIFSRIHRHYLSVGRQLAMMDLTKKIEFRKIKHTCIIPVSGIHRGVYEALQYALTIAEDVRACYVDIDSDTTQRITQQWLTWAPSVPFVVLKSPYRSVIAPLLQYIDDVERIACDDLITVVVPEFVTTRWWHRILHNQTAMFVRAALATRKGKVVTSVRYHLKKF